MLTSLKKLTFLLFLPSIIACKSALKASKPMVTESPKQAIITVIIPKTDTTLVNYWTTNNCNRPIPTPLFAEDSFEKHTFILNDSIGQATEQLNLPTGETIIITHKGCSAAWFGFELKMDKTTFPKEKEAQTRLALATFKQFALNAPPSSPIAFDKYYNVLNSAITQMGDIPFGIEMEIKPQPREFFTIESAQIIDNQGIINFSIVKIP
jgi:hypothetical protein